MTGQTRYTKCGDLAIAYQVTGEGPVDLVYAHGWLSHLEQAWESERYARFLNRLGGFSRLIRFDRRGVGLSDRHVPPSTLEQRSDDIIAVMDAAHSKRAALFGVSEGGFMSVMFAATHPERVSALILCGCFAKHSWSPDYPWGEKRDAREARIEAFINSWGEPFVLDQVAPSVAYDAKERAWFGRFLRNAGSPGAAKALSDLNYEIDMRAVLPSVRVPTLVLHRKGDRWYTEDEARYLADNIPGATLKILPGDDHLPWYGDQEQVAGEIQEFLTGARHSPVSERVLLTVLVTDIVGSTETAAALGDRRWKELLEAHDGIVRRTVASFAGQEINTTGDGFILAFTGPTRAIQCAQAIAAGVAGLGVKVRAGLHTGECERRGRDLSGLAVHIAARIAQAASPGAILTSGTVKDLVVGSGTKFAASGTHALKGVPDEWPLYAVMP